MEATSMVYVEYHYDTQKTVEDQQLAIILGWINSWHNDTNRTVKYFYGMNTVRIWHTFKFNGAGDADGGFRNENSWLKDTLC